MTTTTANSSADAAAVVMTEERIRAECRNRGGYSTPELNEKLYLHHIGFTTVGGLEAFTGCTVLYLSHNAVSDLAPLACLPQLKMLYLSHNGLQSCESLPCLPELITLDVAYNGLADLRGVTAETVPKLQTLLASHNQLRVLDPASSLCALQCLTSLDVSYNQLVEESSVWPALVRMAEPHDGNDVAHGALPLATVEFSGNAFTRVMKAYRKRVIALLRTLRFLDGLPIEAAERMRAEAFVRGGAPEEAHVRAAIEANEAHDKQQRFAYLGDVRATLAQRRETHGKREGPTPYYTAQADAQKTDSNDDDDNDPIYVPGQPAP